MVDQFQGAPQPGGPADHDVRVLLDTAAPFEGLDEARALPHDGAHETPFAGIRASGVHAPPLPRGSLWWVVRFRRLFGLRF